MSRIHFRFHLVSSHWLADLSLAVPTHLWQVVSTQGGIHCRLPGNVQGDYIPHSLHLMNDSIGIGQGLSVCQVWQL
jgi:hypothetical protein